MLLAGDIGVAKTTLAVYSSETSPQKPLVQRQYPSNQYTSLGAVIREFLDDIRLPIQYGCFAVAGPVINGRAHMTNLPWKDIVEEELSEELNFLFVRIMNDVEAVANSITHLLPGDIRTIRAGKAVPNGSIGIIAPTTGLGVAYMTWDGLEYRAHSSEGGHTNFAPNNATELKLLTYLWQQYEHVSNERLCSRGGISDIYAFFREDGLSEVPAIKTSLKQAEQRQRPMVIIQEALKKNPDPLCKQTIETFVTILGGIAGDLALAQLASGGVYMTGEMMNSMLPLLAHGPFLEAFQSKGRLKTVLANIPIHVILTRTVLSGAAGYGLKLIYRGIKQL